MVKRISIAAIVLLIACKEQALKQAVVTTDTTQLHYPAVLPTAVSNYIRDSFPQWRVVEKRDYSKTWWSFYDSSYNPCWARTDINDDQLADYAVWIKKNARLRLLICTGKGNQLFNHSIVIDSSKAFNDAAHNLQLGVAVAPPGQIDVVKPRIQSLVLKSNGFALMVLEERTRIWHQENKSIQTFYMK